MYRRTYIHIYIYTYLQCIYTHIHKYVYIYILQYFHICTDTNPFEDNFKPAAFTAVNHVQGCCIFAQEIHGTAEPDSSALRFLESAAEAPSN